MPKEAKKRGRRAEKKRKEEAEVEEVKVEEEQTELAEGAEYQTQDEAYYEGGGGGGAPNDIDFHGLLTDAEAEYFRNADSVLEANTFPAASDRALFIGALYREAAGKELKIAHSQGCSRLLEKLILLSTPAQLKSLWRALSGHWVSAVQHRFASHCCEVLLEQSVVAAARETEGGYEGEQEEGEGGEGDVVWASMENLWLFMLNELTPHIQSLLTHRFASHPIRALLLLLSGHPITQSESLIQSRKKEKITIASDFAAPTTRDPNSTLTVPTSFTDALSSILSTTAAALTPDELRSMAVHPIGSPSLQVLLQLEMQQSAKERKKRGGDSFLGKLTGVSSSGDEDTAAEGGADGGGGASFFTNLLYDPIGSHLAEKIMSYAPKRDFKRLYTAHFRTRMGSLARNETAGFVVCRVLEKLAREALVEAVAEIVPMVKGMVERGQTAVVKSLVDCCAKQGVEVGGVAEVIREAYECEGGELVLKMLGVTAEELVKEREAEEEGKVQRVKRDPKGRHGSLLAQSMLQLPGEFHRLICESILAQTPETITGLSLHPLGSHIIQSLLLSPHSTIPDTRKLLNLLRHSFATLAVHPSGSHIVDAAWTATAPIMNYKQSIAAELLAGEPALRDSFFGRTVWRNWSMDKYKTRRTDWIALAKSSSAPSSVAGSLTTGVGALGLGNNKNNNRNINNNQERKKTPLELARERHGAAKRAATGGPTTGVNAVAPSTKRQRLK